MKKILLSLFALLTCMVSAQAQTYFEKDGLRYYVWTEAWDDNPGDVYVAKYSDEMNEYTGDIDIPATVTYTKTYNVIGIQSQAFKDCSGLTSVTIPNSVTTIEDRAFYGCESLASITIGDGVTNISWEVFKGCESLTSVTIPNSVEYMSNNVFEKCSNLSEVTLSNKLETIEYSTFQNCESLTSITIPNKVTEIRGSAFSGCTSLTSITIPNKVTTIGSSAFQGCSELTEIILSEKLKTIENNAFYNCTSLASITIPEGVTTIGYNAFYGCTSLASVTIPSTVTKIGGDESWEGSVFQNCTSLESITIPSKVKAIKYCTFSGCTSLASVTMSEGVTTIGESAFQNCTSLESITIPDGVTTIQRYAFQNCTGLTSITIPNSVKKLGDLDDYNNGGGVFSGCNNLTSVTLSNQLTTIEKNTFDGCKNLASVTIPSSVTKISDWAFHDCFALTSIEIPDGVTEIGENAFWNCNKLESITIPGNVEKIGENAFLYCGSLTRVTSEIETPFKVNAFDGVLENAALVVPKDKRADYKGTEGWNFSLIFEEGETVCDRELTDEQGIIYTLNQADDNSLYYTVTGYSENLKSEVVIPDELGGTAELKGFPVTTIQGSVFNDCKTLTKVTISNNVTSIGDWAFQSCGKLTDVILSDQLTTIGRGVFYNCYSLTSIIIPNSVTTIGEEAFAACNKLADVQLSNQLTTIERSAFNGSGLTSITIPSSVTTIGEYAFGNCYNVTKVISEIMEPKEVDAFNGWDYNATLVVPEGLVATYKSLSGWNNFGMIIEDGETVAESEKTEEGIKYALRQAEDNSVYYAATEITDAEMTEIVIPTELDGCPVKAIEGWNFFQNCKSLTKVTIPSSVTAIDGNPFYSCMKLDDVNIIVLDYAAFCNNQILGKFDNPIWDDNSNQKYYTIHLIDSVGKEITEYIVPEGVTTIGDRAFKSCKGLTSITIPEGVTAIGGNAFNDCTSLASITIPSSVTTIGNSAFSGCYGINELNVVVTDYAGFCNSQILKAFEYPTISGYDNEKGEWVYSRYTIHLKDSVGYEISEYIIPDGVTTIGEATFRGCVGLTSITIPNSMTSIGKEAFKGCSNLASVKMGKKVSITSIGDYAFYDCASLSSITLPKKLESIGNYAFSGDDIWKYSGDKYLPVVPLTSITIPGSVKTIGNSAFRACRDLALVNFENVEEGEEGGLTSIGDEAFWGCALTSVTLPNTVTTIGSKAFEYNDKLTTAILGDALTEIKDETFQYCGALASVTIPDGVTSIGKQAFSGCWSLTSVRIPKSLTTMGENAFQSCQLKSIELPDPFTDIPANLFQSNDFEYIKLGKNVKSIGKNAFGSKVEGEETQVVIEIGTSTPPTIASDAFPNLIKEDGPGLGAINVIVPDAAAETAYKKAATWKDMSYANMETVVEVTVNKAGDLDYDLIIDCGVTPSKVVSLKVKGAINADDFNQMRTNMKSLLSLDLSECDITEIPEGAMQGKTQLQELTLPTKLQTIGNYAFQGCPYLTGKLDLPAGVTSIGDGAFEGTDYTSVNLPSKLQSIGSRAFYNLPIKQKINLPDALTKIGDEAFAETQIYGVADMPNSVTYLGSGAFRNTQIEDMFLPEDNVTSVSRGLFQGCSKLDVIGIPKNFTEVSAFAFDGCTNLSYVRMSPNLTTIGEYAFQNTKVEFIKVPSKVEILTDGVFKNCKSLESLALPANLNTVGAEAMRGCSGLRNLSVEAITPPTVEKNSMIGVNTDLCLISIPTESYKAYVVAEYWGQFVQMRNDIAVETEGNGEIAFESVDEEDDGVSDARAMARVQRYVAARARAKTRGAGEEEEELDMTFANNGSSVYIPKNGKVRFYIIPAEAETLQSATLDGVDITNDIKDGVYTATADKKDAKLVVKFSGVAPNATEPITIGKNGKTTYCGDKSLDFSGFEDVKAFIATGFDKNEEIIWMTRVKDVPAGVPVMIKGTANETYHVPVTEGGTSYYKNMFVGNTTGESMSIGETSEDGQYVNYYMSGGLFKKVNGFANIGNNKCYLQLPATFEAETTGEGLQVKIAASGKSSFAAPYDLDFTDLGDDLKAFTATGFDKSTNTIWLTRVKKVQKGEGLMLKGTGGETYTIPSTGIQASYENMIVGNISGGDLIINETSDDGTLTNFYLKGGTYMSVKVTATIGNNKSYLELPTFMLAGAGARSETADDAQTAYDFVEMETESMPIIFGSIGDGDGETTGIVSMDNGQCLRRVVHPQRPAHQQAYEEGSLHPQRKEGRD